VSVQLPPGNLYGEHVRSHKVASFALSERFYPPRFETPKHSHKQALFCFVIQGNYTETYGGRTRECKPSTLLFHPPEEMHAEHFHDSGGHSFIIEIEPLWLARLRELRALPEPSAGFKWGVMELLARRLYNEFVHLDEVSDLIIEGLMFELVGEAVRGCSVPEANHAPRWLIQAKELLHEHFAESLKLDDMAQAVGVHPVHLAQTFHKSFGCTVGDYVRRLRIERACHELATTESPIVDIALATGFCDQSHFTRTFKRVIGVAPSQYRHALRPTRR
jgi:AraC family transcriptional regulator